ncbi:MAG: molybdate ABC transporter permease subunit [Halanaerobiales bacterium]|nr:molybdate ABC transporter permease subunit [Halanaerobiales bacterium]
MKIPISFKFVSFLIFSFFVIFIFVILITPILYIKENSNLLSILFFNNEICFSLFFSLATSFISVFVASILALPVGYVLSKYEFAGKKVFDILFDLPTVLPPLVMGLSLLILFGPVIGDDLAKLGISFVYTRLGVILAQFIVAFPLIVRSFKNAFDSVDPEIEKAAVICGASEFKIFTHIILPISRNSLISGIALGWSRAIGELGATIMLAGTTKFKTETLPIAIFLNISTGDIDVAIAISFIMILFSFIILGIMKTFNKNIGGD